MSKCVRTDATASGFGSKVASGGKKTKGKAGKESAAAPVSDEERPCACGSRRLYKECCREFHQGAWAPTALDLTRARFSASVLGLEAYLVNTTHPDSSDVKGVSKRLSGESLQRLRHLTAHQSIILDMAHGEITEKVCEDHNREGTGGGKLCPDSWYLLTAHRATQRPKNVTAWTEHIVYTDLCRKHDGRWLFWKSFNYYLPLNSSVDEFARKWRLLQEPASDGEGYKYEEEGEAGSSYDEDSSSSRDEPPIELYTFKLAPPRPPGPNTEPWAVDTWAHEQLASGTGELVNGFVFLDNVDDPDGDVKRITAAEAKAAVKSIEDEKIRQGLERAQQYWG